MSVNGLQDAREFSWRPGDNLLAWAFIISLFTHVLVYGTYVTGHHLGWWKKDLMPSWLKSTQQILAEAKAKQKLQPQMQREAPLVFVEVNPAAATAEAPKNATHYSSHNSKADNANAELETELAKIDGRQTHVAKTMTASKSQQFPLQPSPRNPQPETRPETKPNGGKPPGDLAFNKPSLTPGETPSDNKPQQNEPEVRHRPRTIAEAEMQKALAGEKMKQEGGVKPRLRLDSLDTVATSYGAYDDELINAIQSHWDDLLQSRQFTRDRTGKVVVEFVLNYDGSISDLHVVDEDVGDLLSTVCQLAIRDPAPFRPWPTEMRRLMGDHRDVRFTFFYE